MSISVDNLSNFVKCPTLNSNHKRVSRKNIPENWFEHFQHLALGFMPHCSASIDSGNRIRSFGLSHICLAGLCMNWDSFVILGNIIFVQTNPRIIKEIIIHTKDYKLNPFCTRLYVSILSMSYFQHFLAGFYILITC